MNDSVLDVATRTVAFGGEQLVVSPLRIGQIPAFTRAIKPCFAALASLIASVPSGEKTGGGGEPSFDVSAEQIAELIADNGDHLIAAVAIATRKPQDEVKNLLPDEFIAVARAIVEVNVDFFGRAVKGLVKDAVAEAGNGLTPSNS